MVDACPDCHNQGWRYPQQKYCTCSAGRALKLSDQGWINLGRTTDGQTVMARKIEDVPRETEGSTQ